ncbi:MAG: Wzz/FepE/Etk N-terminal domain-containing protein [bacterium]
MHSEDWKKELCEMVFAQSRLIVWTTVVVIAMAILIATFWPPTYAASGSVLIRTAKPQNSPGTLEQTDLRNFPVSKEDLASELEILSSPDLIQQTVLAMRGKVRDRSVKTDKVIMDEVARIKNGLKTEVILASHVIRVTLMDRDAHRAETTLDALLEQYMIYRVKVFNPSDQQLFFSNQASLYKARLEKIEDQLSAKAKEASIALVDREMANNVDMKKDRMAQISVLRDEYLQKEKSVASFKQAVEQGDVQFFSFLENRSINDLGAQLMVSSVERSKILREFQPGSEKVKAIDEQIAQLYKSLRFEAARLLDLRVAELQALNNRINQLETTVKTIGERNIDLQRQSTEIQRISREAALMQYSYETFSKRAEEAQINDTIANSRLSGDISILSHAAFSAVCVFPKVLWVLFLGLIAGLVTGCSIGLLAEFFDHTFKRPSDVIRYAGLPVVCSIKLVK